MDGKCGREKLKTTAKKLMKECRSNLNNEIEGEGKKSSNANSNTQYLKKLLAGVNLERKEKKRRDMKKESDVMSLDQIQ